MTSQPFSFVAIEFGVAELSLSSSSNQVLMAGCCRSALIARCKQTRIAPSVFPVTADISRLENPCDHNSATSRSDVANREINSWIKRNSDDFSS